MAQILIPRRRLLVLLYLYNVFVRVLSFKSMAAAVCVVRLETGEQKKVVLPTGSYDELVHALSTHTAVDEQTLPTSSECIEAGPSSMAHDPSREHLNQRFPSKELYNTAVEQLIQKYPHLQDNIKKGTGMELWKLALKNKFKNNRKKTQNIPEEMEAMRVINTPKRPRVPGPEEINKKLYRLSDNPELIVYGETAEGRRRHHEWLTENASTAGDDELRPCLLATAKERHEGLERMTIQQALLEYPFLATEHSLQLKFNLLFKKNILDDIMKGFECLCGMSLSHGHQEEVTDFSTLASEDAILGVLRSIANRCNDSLETLLTDKADTPLTPCIQRAIDGTLVLHADNQCLFVASSLLSAVASLFFLFWVFHIKYPKKADRVLTFIEHAFVDLSQTKPKVKALELMNFYKNIS
ncbi:uncharacterized protein LOC142775738 isoform X7 [Rhipicephalus microplus]|uniref:uncharacterized protein LOC142775738 isoform X7 n=1 Tax=Rhipicephalus microplus TaxID=6941 RepID=UPI003F6CEF0C